MKALLLLAPALLLAQCSSSARSDPYGTWIGALKTEKGTCPDMSTSSLMIYEDRITFVPGGGALKLTGRFDEESATYHAQLVLQDRNKKPLPLVFEAHPEKDKIVGVYGTPSCRAHITLERPTSHTWQNIMGH